MRNVSLSDKFDVTEGTIFITGKQALARVPLLQRELDKRRGLRTAGYISGYRGSPLGTLDNELLKISDRLAASDIVFEPGLNEDLAMTAVWGSQQIDFVPGRRFDGVFAMWYGKGPGVDRSGDAIKHANMSGTHPNGGVLLAFGDDHTGKSSSLAHQSDLALAAHEVPVFYPSDVNDILKFALAGIAMSRECGLLAGLKLVNETADCTQSVRFSLAECTPALAPDADRPTDVGIRVEMLAVVAQDQRMVRRKLPSVHAFTRRNRIDRIAFGSERPTALAIVTAGKPFQDVMDALRLLGIDHEAAKRLGIGVLKAGLIYPLDPEPLSAFTERAKEVLFVEEKRPHMELQAASLLYNAARRPAISGKRDPEGRDLLPLDEALDASIVALAIGRRIRAVLNSADADTLGAAIGKIEARADEWKSLQAGPLARRPVFCSGCPHNRSTQIPSGSFGVAGIGCHGLVQFMDRDSLPCTHMGAEGLNWVGLSHFTATPHVFVNLGDGTFSHSGSLAIRAAASSKANVTFKILANDIVAMTGGQTIESGLSVDAMVRQVLLEGVSKVVVVAEDPDAVRSKDALPREVTVVHRTQMENVQKELRKMPGTTVIVYVQVCATENRKRRKRGTVAPPSKHVVINAGVCEGCGDCSRISNCMSVQPLETEFGRKRRIEQSSCNTDLSCLEGFCPSFVTIEGGQIRKPEPLDLRELVAALPEPMPDAAARLPFGMLTCGIGGSGGVTTSAILGMAAHLEGRGVSIYDMTGLAQKGGSVFSHLRIMEAPDGIAPLRIGPEDSSLLVASDLAAATQIEALRTISRRTDIFADSHVQATQKFHENANIDLDAVRLVRHLETQSSASVVCVLATDLARRAFGDTIAANMILVGAAFQAGKLPLSSQAIEAAIELNGSSVDAMLRAFRLGRLAYSNKDLVEKLLRDERGAQPAETPPLDRFEDRLRLRLGALRAYQDDAYAETLALLIDGVRSAEERIATGSTMLADAVLRNAFKLMAYKDEYEVARLLTDEGFWSDMRRRYDGGTLKLHLAPPVLGGRDPATGRPRKRAFSASVWLPLLRALARGKILRGTRLDPFGWLHERKMEREIRDEYLETIRKIVSELRIDNYDLALRLAAYPEEIRGYGPVKEQSIRTTLNRAEALREEFASACGGSGAASSDLVSAA